MITVADVDGDIVLMDSVADSYLCVGDDQRCDRRAPESSIRNQPSADRVVELLAAAGVDAMQWRWAPPGLVYVRHEMPAGASGNSGRVIASIPFMVRAGLTTMRRLRGPIADYGIRADHAEPSDPARVWAAVAVFETLRPFVPRLGRCLPHSLYMREFLGLYGIATTLVFGVRTRPFEAHCWVEHEGCVLNDTTEHVALFTPIYAC